MGLPHGGSSLIPISESPTRPGTPAQEITADNAREDAAYRFLNGDNNINNNNDNDALRGEPFSPQEDPDLVGHEAAARARQTRLYMQRCGDEEALRQEKKTWDFMLGQMNDWRERERSWEQFRREVGRSRVLGRRGGDVREGGGLEGERVGGRRG